MPPEENQEIEFGWLPEMFECATNLVNISMLDSYDRAVQNVKDYEETGKHWTYPPYIDSPTEKCRKPSVSFVLPSTHRIFFLNEFCDDSCAKFYITLLGYCNGLCLIPSSGRFIYRTAISKGQLSGFYSSKKETEKFLYCLDRFVIKHKKETVKKLGQIVSIFLKGQVFQTTDTKFFYQYAVLDALYALCEPIRRDAHPYRIKALSERFNLILPTWATDAEGVNCQKSPLALLRNYFFHEAVFDASQNGRFQEKNFRITFELTNFNSRLIAAIVGYDGDFCRSSCQTRSMHGFRGTYNPSLAL